MKLYVVKPNKSRTCYLTKAKINFMLDTDLELTSRRVLLYSDIIIDNNTGSMVKCELDFESLLAGEYGLARVDNINDLKLVS